MIVYKTREEIELIKESSLLVSKTLGEINKIITPGITPLELDKFAETVDYYNYWMQAVIYITLVIKNCKEDIVDYNTITD